MPKANKEEVNPALESLTHQDCVEYGVLCIRMYLADLGMTEVDISPDDFILKQRVDKTSNLLGYHKHEGKPVVFYSDYKNNSFPNSVIIINTIHEGFHFLADKMGRSKTLYDHVPDKLKPFADEAKSFLGHLGFFRYYILQEGYRFQITELDEGMLLFFEGFNEAIVQAASLDAYEYLTEIDSSLFPVPPNIPKDFIAYEENLMVLNAFIEEYVKRGKRLVKGIDFDSVRNELIKAQFIPGKVKEILGNIRKLFFMDECFLLTFIGVDYDFDEINSYIGSKHSNPLIKWIFESYEYNKHMKELSLIPNKIVSYFKETDPLKRVMLIDKFISSPGFLSYYQTFRRYWNNHKKRIF